jgi:glycosyltransferase involved in cell wall biosynthesis
MPRIPIVVFAQVPPPEHGQSRMVQMALESLRADPERFDIHHVNARFSETLEDIGDSSIRKAFPIAKYLFHAVRLRFRLAHPLLYYVPGPAKWSAVFRDWVLLTVLRLFYKRLVFHWHAIGQGEWAQGSSRLALGGPAGLERLARAVSGVVLSHPYASIAVCPTTQTDSRSVGSKLEFVVCNGIEDPCADFETSFLPARAARYRDLASSPSPCFRILFLSHGTVEKGLLDALKAIHLMLDESDPHWNVDFTIAGGICEELQVRFGHEVTKLRRAYPERLRIEALDYVRGSEKCECFRSHEIFLAPSRWESFGLTVVEAMANGMLVVAAASDGVRGVLPEGYPYLSPVADPRALAANLQGCCTGILRDPEASLETSTTLRSRFLDCFLIKSFSSNLLEVFTCLGVTRSFDKGRAGAITRGSATSGGAPLAPHSDGDKWAEHGGSRPTGASPLIIAHPAPGTSSPISNLQSPISLSVYLADQNPGYDRSFGISRMSQVVLDALHDTGRIEIETISSQTSQQAPARVSAKRILPWGTRRKTVRLLTDHLHPLFNRSASEATVHYFPKGYLPLLDGWCSPSVVTIHDTIIQYDEDHYPNWRRSSEYTYWAMMLKHTLRKANRIMTVSESSRKQIITFMDRHGIPTKDITVTYEPCLYEHLAQPEQMEKDNYVIHLASCEPHKRTSHLVRWWSEAEGSGRRLPMLHLIGNVPPEVMPLLQNSTSIVKRPFLADEALQAAYRGAKALILPSEIEGFGLPALEAYYLGTPVCYVRSTSVEEVLAVATDKGGFGLGDSSSLFQALDEVLAMSAAEVRACGLKLRETYAAEKVAARMLRVFEEVSR